MARVVVFGNSALAALAHLYLEHDSPHEVVAFTVDGDQLPDGPRGEGETYRGLPLVPFEALERHYPAGEYKLFIPISFQKMSHVRADKYRQAKERGYEFVSYVSSKATVWPGFVPGENCFIFEDNTIQPFVTIGNNCVLWSGNHIAHHTVIKDHVFITSQVAISSGCLVEEHCFFGVNSTVRDETIVGRETLVGAGALILSDTEPYAVYQGEGTAPVAGFRSDELMRIAHRS